jgi:hypothetical protein
VRESRADLVLIFACCITFSYVQFPLTRLIMKNNAHHHNCAQSRMCVQPIDDFFTIASYSQPTLSTKLHSFEQDANSSKIYCQHRATTTSFDITITGAISCISPKRAYFSRQFTDSRGYASRRSSVLLYLSRISKSSVLLHLSRISISS